MVKRIDVSPSAIVKLNGLEGHVIQNIFNDAHYTFSMYAEQYDNQDHSNVVYESDDPNFDYLSKNFDRPKEISFDKKNPYIKIGSADQELSGHSQTLIVSDGLVITGANLLNFDNIPYLLEQWNLKKDKNIDSFLDGFNTASARELKKSYHALHKSDNTKGIHWTTRLGAFRQYSDSNDDNGKKHDANIQSAKRDEYVLITGFDQVLANRLDLSADKIVRIEATVDNQDRYFLIAVNTVSNVYLIVYDCQTINHKLIEKLNDAVLERSILYNPTNSHDHKWPDGKSDLSDDELDCAIDWLKACLKQDDFVLDLSGIDCLDCVQISTQLLVDVTNQPSASYQGFAIDRDKNIYIAGGLGPDDKKPNDDYNNRIICIPDFGHDLQNATYFNLDRDDLDRYLTQTFTLEFYDYYLEIEGIQDLYPYSDHCLLVVLAMHRRSNGLKTEHNICLKYAWNDDDVKKLKY